MNESVVPSGKEYGMVAINMPLDLGVEPENTMFDDFGE